MTNLLLYVRYVLLFLAAIIVQKTFIILITISDAVPDLVVIALVYLALREGQVSATVAGFACGLFLDLLAGDFLGIAAFSNTIVGFVTGYFYNQNRTTLVSRGYAFPFIVLLGAIVHNLVYFVIYTQGSDIKLLDVLVKYGFGASLYTAVISVILTLIATRRQMFT
jgi:rod shape-determining protein MreD